MISSSSQTSRGGGWSTKGEITLNEKEDEEQAKQIEVISILGPRGTGKTRLARKVYDMYRNKSPSSATIRGRLGLAEDYCLKRAVSLLATKTTAAAANAEEDDRRREVYKVVDGRIFLSSRRRRCTRGLVPLQGRPNYCPKLSTRATDDASIRRRRPSLTMHSELLEIIAQVIYSASTECAWSRRLHRRDGPQDHLHLKYLSLRNTGVTQLPKHIQNLQQLETLDVRGTNASKLDVVLPMLKELHSGQSEWSLYRSRRRRERYGGWRTWRWCPMLTSRIELTRWCASVGC